MRAPPNKWVKSDAKKRRAPYPKCYVTRYTKGYLRYEPGSEIDNKKLQGR